MRKQERRRKEGWGEISDPLPGCLLRLDPLGFMESGNFLVVFPANQGKPLPRNNSLVFLIPFPPKIRRNLVLIWWKTPRRDSRVSATIPPVLHVLPSVTTLVQLSLRPVSKPKQVWGQLSRPDPDIRPGSTRDVNKYPYL